MPVYLNALAIQFYRGIGPEIQYIGPFSDMNFFIGANNAGKSIILNLIHERLPFGEGATENTLPSDSAEAYIGTKTGSFAAAVGVGVEEFVARVSSNMRNGTLETLNPSSAVRRVTSRIAKEGHVWLHHGHPNKRPLLWGELDVERAANWLKSAEWNDLHEDLVQKSGGSLKQHWVPDTLKAFASVQSTQLPICRLVPAKRQLGPKDDTFDDLSGKGLIDHLADLQNPNFNERHKRKVFDSINQFIRVVTGKASAELEVPSNRGHLLVHMDEKVLPIEQLGTGIHEVVLIAAFCTIHQECIMCIEEPEIHLHPVLQRKLIAYLRNNTENQYFIATHSAAFIDTPDASVFGVRNDGKQTYVDNVVVRGDKRQLCADLGYRASDIMQSNAVVWVEGPSDRTYVKHWLTAEAPELVEGVHFTIMFFGGGLISYLSADDDAVTEFIKLRELNQHIAIIIDSDKSSSSAALKPAAKRLKDELNDGSGIAWVTKGREIENYVKPELLHQALQEIHPRIYKKADLVGQYDHAFYFHRRGARKPDDKLYKHGDKVGAARVVCEHPADLGVLDLQERITEVATMIRSANGIELEG